MGAFIIFIVWVILGATGSWILSLLLFPIVVLSLWRAGVFDRRTTELISKIIKQ